MPPSLATTQKDRIAHFLHEGMAPIDIASVEGVSRRTVEKIRANLETFDDHTAPKFKKMGRPSALTPGMQAALRFFLEAKPWAYLEEMALYLFDEFDVVVALSTISRSLKNQMKISRKVMKKEALERSQTCRNAYMLRISEFISDQLVFLDESAANEHTMNRKHGWASVGISPSVIRSVKRGERYSILPAYAIDGILAYHLYQGSIIGSRFEWFFREEVLPRCNAYPGPKSVLIMDNASIHHTEVKEFFKLHLFLLIKRHLGNSKPLSRSRRFTRFSASLFP